MAAILGHVLMGVKMKMVSGGAHGTFAFLLHPRESQSWSALLTCGRPRAAALTGVTVS